MRNKTKILILASILLAGCTTDPLQESPDATGGPEQTAAAKICNTSDELSGDVSGQIQRRGHSLAGTGRSKVRRDTGRNNPLGHR